MTGRPRRRRVETTDDWEQVQLLCAWPEQRDYELIRPLVLFGRPADGRAEETGESYAPFSLVVSRCGISVPPRFVLAPFSYCKTEYASKCT